jgi:hypothetical protein
MALSNGHIGAARMLIQAGANVRAATNVSGSRALIEAVFSIL